MIEIHPLRDLDKLKQIYNCANISMNDMSMAVVVSDGNEILGNCLFDMCDDCITIHHLEPTDDVFLADGILRSALHVGVENGKMVAFYTETAPQSLFLKLGFIKNAENRQLNVQKLFDSCESCKNN